MFIRFLLWTVKYDKIIYSFSTPKYDKIPFLLNKKRKKKNTHTYTTVEPAKDAWLLAILKMCVPFWSVRARVVLKSTIGVFWGRYRFFHSLLRSRKGHWVKIRSLKQSHSPIRHNTDPVFHITLACEKSLIFLCKVTARETQARKRRDKRRRIHYCNVTSLYAIALAQIRTRLILREKEDGKQCNTTSKWPVKMDASNGKFKTIFWQQWWLVSYAIATQRAINTNPLIKNKAGTVERYKGLNSVSNIAIAILKLYVQ